MLIQQIIRELENLAPPIYQESYDNAGLITGNKTWDCYGILCCLDCTEDVINEAVNKKCNLIVAHHPIVFSGLKRLNGNNYVERTVIAAIKNDIAIYAIHTNLDNVTKGVSNYMADKLGLLEKRILSPKQGFLYKLYTYVPLEAAEKVRTALFAEGAGKIGSYEECSFDTNGQGTFKPIEGASPFIGKVGTREKTEEVRIEVMFPAYLQSNVLKALFKAHPYETVAYEIIKLENKNQEVGSGMIGRLPKTLDELSFLQLLKETFGLKSIRHTPFLNKPIRTVALCGGAGSFLTKTAIGAGADAYITADVKYHEFFDADNHLLLTDIGHWESEQYTIALLAEFLQDKFLTFAVLKTEVNTNPVGYFS